MMMNASSGFLLRRCCYSSTVSTSKSVTAVVRPPGGSLGDSATTVLTRITTTPSKRCYHPSRMTGFSVVRGRPANITPEERAALRAARKEQATRVLQQQQQPPPIGTQSSGTLSSATTTMSTSASAATSTTTTSSSNTTTATTASSMVRTTRWMWYLGLGVPAAVLVWGFRDEDSPPARLSQWVGLTGLVQRVLDPWVQPAYDKLLPDWSQMPNVPHDIPVPHTLVLDLEQTLVSSTWDRKYGWRHAKRPGVDKFLHELAQYYEIILYSPSIDAIADPVVSNLDKDGCIMHRLYRDATHYYNGVHVKDLKLLNRNLKRMIVLDDDPQEVQFNLENLIRVKPYTDPTDRSDTTLLRIIPFLIEIAREGYDDIPALLRQYQGMDADMIADEQERRLQALREYRQAKSNRGLGRIMAAGSRNLPAPELSPVGDAAQLFWSSNSSSATTTAQPLTSKDIAAKALLDAGLPNSDEGGGGLIGWMNARAKEKEEHQRRKMEKWNQVLMQKQKEKQERIQQQQQQQ